MVACRVYWRAAATARATRRTKSSMRPVTSSGIRVTPARPSTSVPSPRPPAISRYATAAPSLLVVPPGAGHGTGTGPPRAEPGAWGGSLLDALRSSSMLLSRWCQTRASRGAAPSSSSHTAHQSASLGTRSCAAIAAIMSSSNWPVRRSDASARKESAPRLLQSLSYSRAVRRGTGARISAARSPRCSASSALSAGPAGRAGGTPSTAIRAQTVLRPVR